MSLIPQRIRLPLMTRELLEQSARWKTWAVRCMYATGVFAISFLMFQDQIRWLQEYDPYALLGKGGLLLDDLYWMLLCGTWLVMPGLACATVTSEKERDTLGLLLITKLGPWTIVLEKFLGRLVPMLLFMSACLPLAAVAYLMGGTDLFGIALRIVHLISIAAMLAALGVACSTWSRTTLGAFLIAYFTAVCLVGLALFSMRIALGTWIWRAVIGAPIVPATRSFQMLGLPWVVTAALLLFSRRNLVRRGFLRPRNLFLRFFQEMDAFFKTVNNRYGRGIVLLKDNAGMPEENPVAWRETSKRSIGSLRYALRMFVLIEGPLLGLIAGSMILGMNGPGTGLMEVAVIGFWFFAMLTVLLQAAGLFATERAAQTLDLLLVSPISTASLLSQKLRGLRRCCLVLAGLLFGLSVFEWLFFGNFTSWTAVVADFFQEGILGFCPAAHMAGMSVAGFLVLPTIGRLGVLVSLRTSSRTRAILLGSGILMFWCFLPMLIAGFVDSHWTHNGFDRWIAGLSPLGLVVNTETGRRRPDIVYYTSISVIYLLELIVLHLACHISARRRLRRIEPPLLRPPMTPPPRLQSRTAVT